MNQRNCAVGLSVAGEEGDVHLEVEQQETRVEEEPSQEEEVGV